MPAARITAMNIEVIKSVSILRLNIYKYRIICILYTVLRLFKMPFIVTIFPQQVSLSMYFFLQFSVVRECAIICLISLLLNFYVVFSFSLLKTL